MRENTIKFTRNLLKSATRFTLGFTLCLVGAFAPLNAKEPTNILFGVGFGAGRYSVSVEHLHAARYPFQRDDNSFQTTPQSNYNAQSWALAWELMLGYKHFINDFIGFRYYANVGVQHYDLSIFESKNYDVAFVDYTLNADLLINFFETSLLSIGIFSGVGVGGASFNEAFIKHNMQVYGRDSGTALRVADVKKHFVSVNANLGARLVFFQKIRRVKSRVCDEYVNGRRICRVPVFYLGHSLEFATKFQLVDYNATQNPDIIQDGTDWVSRPAYKVGNRYKIMGRYIVDF